MAIIIPNCAHVVKWFKGEIMKGIGGILILFLLALIACGLGTAITAGKAENVAIYAIDSQVAFASDPQTRLEQNLANQQSTSLTNDRPSFVPFLIGAAAMLGVYGYFTQKERDEAKAKRLKEERLLSKQQKKLPTASTRPQSPRLPFLPLPVPQLRPYPTSPPSTPSNDEGEEIEGETW